MSETAPTTDLLAEQTFFRNAGISQGKTLSPLLLVIAMTVWMHHAVSNLSGVTEPLLTCTQLQPISTEWKPNSVIPFLKSYIWSFSNLFGKAKTSTHYENPHFRIALRSN